MRLHTPSSFPRLRKCLGSACLPWVDEEHEGTERGTALHGVPERVISGSTREEALKAVPSEWRVDAEEVDTTPFELLRGAMVEAGLAWNPETGACRLLGQRMTRESARAACKPGEVPMVLDVLGPTGPGEIAVVDWKFARGEDLGPASEHWQLRTYTACALVALGATSARCFLARWHGLRWRWDEATMDLLEAQAHLEEVRARLEEAEVARQQFMATGDLPPLRRGAWCTWCPSQRSCPAGVATLIAFSSGDPALAAIRAPMELTLEQAGPALLLAKELRKVLDRVINDLNSIARRTPLPLPDGSLYSPQERPRLNPEVAHGALARVFGQEFADMACPVSRDGSLESVRGAIREVLAPARQALVEQGRASKRSASLKVLVEEVRGVLEAAGAFEAKDSTQEPESGPEGAA